MACIRELDRHAKQQELESLRSLACPTCRKNWDFSEVLRVTRTASEQWQDLIEVATEWAKMDIERDEVDIEYVHFFLWRITRPFFIDTSIGRLTRRPSRALLRTIWIRGNRLMRIKRTRK